MTARSRCIRCSTSLTCCSAARCTSRTSRCAAARCVRSWLSLWRSCSYSASWTSCRCLAASAARRGSSRSASSRRRRRSRSASILRCTAASWCWQSSRSCSSRCCTSTSSERRPASCLARCTSPSSAPRSTFWISSSACSSASCARFRAAASRSLRARQWLLSWSTPSACDASSKCHSSASCSHRRTTGVSSLLPPVEASPLAAPRCGVTRPGGRRAGPRGVAGGRGVLDGSDAATVCASSPLFSNSSASSSRAASTQ
mmetsp:Transcript_124536/g.346721  ORF Transcript_124536/g.346721 Transcript_124536/m.346721 type:complete len:258 (+) Transcript_124536:789-1562(+)